MNTETRGVLWPLQLVFLVTLALGLVALFDPNVFGAQQGPPDRTIAANLLFAAVVTGVLLYMPRFWIAMKAPDFPAVAARVDAIHDALIDAASGEQKPELIRTEIANLQTALDTVVTQLRNGGEVRARIENINTLLNTGGDVRTRIEAINSQLEAGGPVRSSLAAIEAKIKTS